MNYTAWQRRRRDVMHNRMQTKCSLRIAGIHVDEAQKDKFARFIKALVSHYKDYHALYGWVLINDPGIDILPNTHIIDIEKMWFATTIKMALQCPVEGMD